MLEGILKNVERIDKRINEVSRFSYPDLSGVIILSKDWDSFGVILLSDEREILFSISGRGQLKALHESNQKLVSGLRLKVLDLTKLMEQRERLLQRLLSQTARQSINGREFTAREIENA